jgi:hypothetical protein
MFSTFVRSYATGKHSLYLNRCDVHVWPWCAVYIYAACGVVLAMSHHVGSTSAFRLAA